MSGETDLDLLIQKMSPHLKPGTYVFAFRPRGSNLPEMHSSQMFFREDEGTTFILEEGQAQEAGLTHGFKCRMITLTVRSSLHAVGFMAAVASRLAAAGISANPVSAFHHDHLFVPADRAEEAMAVLQAMRQG